MTCGGTSGVSPLPVRHAVLHADDSCCRVISRRYGSGGAAAGHPSLEVRLFSALGCQAPMGSIYRRLFAPVPRTMPPLIPLSSCLTAFQGFRIRPIAAVTMPYLQSPIPPLCHTVFPEILSVSCISGPFAFTRQDGVFCSALLALTSSVFVVLPIKAAFQPRIGANADDHYP